MLILPILSDCTNTLSIGPSCRQQFSQKGNERISATNLCKCSLFQGGGPYFGISVGVLVGGFVGGVCLPTAEKKQCVSEGAPASAILKNLSQLIIITLIAFTN